MADYYAATDGLAENDGTFESPWDIVSALLKNGVIIGGDTLYLRGGTYSTSPRNTDPIPAASAWSISLQGSPSNYITIKPYNNEHVIIDAQLKEHSSTFPRHLIIRDLEFLITENVTDDVRYSSSTGSPAPDLARPSGGLDFHDGHDIKIVNNVIRDVQQGIGFWGRVSGNSEIYGNIIFDNGWEGTDRNHGHGIYTQNETADWKYVTNNILMGNWSLNMQAYGSTDARVDRFNVSKNIIFKTGKSGDGRLLIGGQYPSQSIVCDSNVAVAAGGGGISIGYSTNGDDLTRTNNVSEGATFGLTSGWTNVVSSNNYHRDNAWAKPRLDGVEVDLPTVPQVFFFPNTYDSDRAHVAAFAYQDQTEATVTVTGFLADGETYSLMDPTDFWGTPVATGEVSGTTITIPLSEAGPANFTTYVILKTAAAPPPAAEATQRVLDGVCVDSDITAQVVVEGVCASLEGTAAPTGITFTVTDVASASATVADGLLIAAAPYFCRVLQGVSVAIISPFYQRVINGVVLDAQTSETLLPTILTADVGEAVATVVNLTIVISGRTGPVVNRHMPPPFRFFM